MSLLRVEGLGVSFPVGSGWKPPRLHAASDVSFSVVRGEVLALVGESGSGKSTIGKLLLRLLRPGAGRFFFDGRDVSRGRVGKDYRRRVQMIFQDPFDSLNPVHTVLYHLQRPLLLHGKAGRDGVRRAAAALLERAGLRPAEDYLDRHVQALSGGQRQRVAIARALASEPELIVADEPTSMLDVSIRVDLLRLLASLREERGLAMIFITHDLAAARLLSDRIGVLYAGRLVELGPADAVLGAPCHPYTHLLRSAAPTAGGSLSAELPAKDGRPPNIDPPPGCPFARRCLEATDVCRTQLPPLVGEPRAVRCHHRAPEAP